MTRFDEEHGLHSREALAGYDRATLEAGVVVLVGCGAAGCNVAQTLALTGVGELRLIDHDVVEPSNLTRSPLFRRERLAPGRERLKVREVGQAVLGLSMASAPRVRMANRPVEALGYGAFEGAGVVISALDSLEGRAYLSDITRELRIPFVELGFMGSEGHVAVFPNRSDEEACWRCLHPRVSPGHLSCRTYARAVVARGIVPATQPLAATFSALAAEAAISALHGRFELGGRHLGLDIRRGTARTLEVTPEPRCPGVHRASRVDASLSVSAKAPLSSLFEALATLAPDPVVHLPAEYVLAAPCALCGGEVSVHRPAWAVTEAPRCKRGCSPRPTLGGRGVVAVASVSSECELLSRSCLSVGIAPRTRLLVESPSRGASFTVEMGGSLDDLYTLRTRDDAPAREGVVLDPPDESEGDETQAEQGSASADETSA